MVVGAPPKKRLILGECLPVMRGLKPDSIDTIITDPPYGLKFMGKKWDYNVPSVEVWQECLRVLKPGGTLLCFAGSRTQHRMAINIEDAGFILKDCIMWLYGSGFPKATDISKQLDKGHERKVVGKKPFTSPDIRGGNLMASQGKDRLQRYETEPCTPEAILWNGWKSHGLKPAYEPILVAMKPNDGTYANNALVHGVSGLNIDESRIDYNGEIPNMGGRATAKMGGDQEYGFKVEGRPAECNTQGRFPANVILDEEVVAGAGEWSRYFYCAKASKAERNAGCEDLQEKIAGSMVANQGETMDLGGASLKGEHKQIQTKKNHHPTVKPLALMEYLCTLTKTPTGGVVLDPFMGSGTTGIACKNTSRGFIGIEKEEEYLKIARARIREA